jgi:hypothetical protein
MKNLYIGFDCAIKSLAVTFLIYDNDKPKNTNIAYLGLYNMFLQKIKHIDIDIIINISKSLKSILNSLDIIKIDIINKYKIQNINILIERQFLPNSSSRIVENMILYHYAPAVNNKIIINHCDEFQHPPLLNDKTITKVELIGPSLKNLYSFNNELSYSKLVTQYKTNKAINKNHTKINFKFYLNYINKSIWLKKFKKSNIDDIADSFMMIIAYICKNEGIMPNIFIQ